MAQCPKCRDAMTTTELAGLPATRCSVCGGLWLAPEVIALWLERRNAPADALRLEGRPTVPTQLDCPDCERTLDRVESHGLHLDHCRRCRGIFFDKRELEAVGRALLARQRGEVDPSAVSLPPSIGDEMIANLDQETLHAGNHFFGHRIGYGIFSLLEIFLDH